MHEDFAPEATKVRGVRILSRIRMSLFLLMLPGRSMLRPLVYRILTDTAIATRRTRKGEYWDDL